MIVYGEVVVYVGDLSNCLEIMNSMSQIILRLQISCHMLEARTVQYFALHGEFDRCNDFLLGCC